MLRRKAAKNINDNKYNLYLLFSFFVVDPP